jgi:hypothetical protein
MLFSSSVHMVDAQELRFRLSATGAFPSVVIEHQSFVSASRVALAVQVSIGESLVVPILLFLVFLFAVEMRFRFGYFVHSVAPAFCAARFSSLAMISAHRPQYMIDAQPMDSISVGVAPR